MKYSSVAYGGTPAHEIAGGRPVSASHIGQTPVSAVVASGHVNAWEGDPIRCSGVIAKTGIPCNNYVTNEGELCVPHEKARAARKK